MNNSNLNLYYIFYTVAECRNISGAAKHLFISQPAISKAISKLENSLNTVLFFRNSRGVKLTPEGELLFRQVESAFHAINQGEEQLKHRNELGVGQLSIGVSTTLCKHMLLPYLQEFIQENPHVKISISCQSTYETIAALENGTLDIGLIGETERMSALHFYPMREISDIFITTQSYLDNLQKRIGLSTKKDTCLSSASLFSESTLLLLDRNNVTRQYIDKYLTIQNVRPEHVLEVTTMDLLIEFSKIGLGIACVIEDFVKQDLDSGNLVRMPFPITIPKRKIGFAFSKSANPTVPMLKFMNRTGVIQDEFPLP